MIEVLFDSSFSKTKLVGNLLIGLGATDQVYDLLLPVGELPAFMPFVDGRFRFAALGAKVFPTECAEMTPATSTASRVGHQKVWNYCV